MLGIRQREELRMTLIFLAQETGRMKFPFTEMRKARKEQGFSWRLGCREQSLVRVHYI